METMYIIDQNNRNKSLVDLIFDKNGVAKIDINKITENQKTMILINRWKFYVYENEEYKEIENPIKPKIESKRSNKMESELVSKNKELLGDLNSANQVIQLIKNCVKSKKEDSSKLSEIQKILNDSSKGV
jgi:uncharacterized protein (UPF0335 family)